MPPGVKFAAIASDIDGTDFLAVDTQGNAWAWGGSDYGQLGNGTVAGYTASPVPVTMPAGVKFTAVASTENNSYALDTHGNAWAWGSNQEGELGLGSGQSPESCGGIPCSTFPIAVDLPSGLTAISANLANPFGGYALALASTAQPPPPPQVLPPTVQAGGFPYAPSTTCSGCPVNTATGEFHHTFNDILVPGRGLALDFNRTYSSAAALAGETSPLGPGWTDSYNWHLSLDSSGNATVTSGNGSSVVFASDGPNGFSAPPYVTATLVKNPDGTYTFEGNQDQKRYNFNANGQLTSEVDRNGYVTNLAYSGGNLATVTDPAGRSLTFSYDANGDLSGVTDPSGHSETLTYDTAGNLATFTDRGGNTWSYGYDANHQLITLTDPRGGVLTNEYDTSGRVDTETDPMGRTTTFAYGPNADGSETTTETGQGQRDPLELHEPDTYFCHQGRRHCPGRHHHLHLRPQHVPDRLDDRPERWHDDLHLFPEHRRPQDLD